MGGCEYVCVHLWLFCLFLNWLSLIKSIKQYHLSTGDTSSLLLRSSANHLPPLYVLFSTSRSLSTFILPDLRSSPGVPGSPGVVF